MKNLLLVLMTTFVAACSTAAPRLTPAAATSDLSGIDLSGRWTGSWKGTGLLAAPREDGVVLELVQSGDRAFGRFALEGTAAAESVPPEMRYAGLWGVRVHGRVSGDKVTLRHEAGGHLFTADLRLAGDGEHLYGYVRGGDPRVALVLTRDGATPPPQSAKATPAPIVPQTQMPPKAEAAPAAEPLPKVVVLVPEPKEPEAPAPPREEHFVDVAELAPIHFDFNKAELRKDAVDSLTAHATWLKDHADALLLIEGHCDERGTDEYNVALGERRAKSVRDLLSTHGIAPERITTTSFGRERPVCTGGTEECRMKNRRAEFRVKTR